MRLDVTGHRRHQTFDGRHQQASEVQIIEFIQLSVGSRIWQYMSAKIRLCSRPFIAKYPSMFDCFRPYKICSAHLDLHHDRRVRSLVSICIYQCPENQQLFYECKLLYFTCYYNIKINESNICLQRRNTFGCGKQSGS
jgi:hypothetical protein